jgi:hypothetical protein
MGLGNIFNVPGTREEWDQWSFSLQAELRDITRRILETKNIFITQFCLDPFNPEEPGVTLFTLQQWMNQINAVLNISGFDYVDVDLKDIGERTSWIFLLSQNVRQAANQLGV